MSKDKKKKNVNSADFLYKTTEYWFPEYEKCILWSDKTLNINWFIKKPVLYVDYQDKINNFDHKGVNFEKLEDIIKYKFGYTLDYKKNCFDNIANLIKESENKYYKNFSNIDSFLNYNFYNFGNVADKAAEQIISSLDL